MFKTVFAASLFSFFVNSLALAESTRVFISREEIVLVTGMGQSFGLCDSNGSYFCIDRIKQDAEREGTQDTQIRCRSMQGDLPAYSVSCNTNCWPNYILPGEDRVHVNCRSSCSGQCKLTKDDKVTRER